MSHKLLFIKKNIQTTCYGTFSDRKNKNAQPARAAHSGNILICHSQLVTTLLTVLKS